MPQVITGALTGHSYTIPELTDPANAVTAFTDFANTLQPYPKVRLDVEYVTADVPAANVQKVYFIETAGPSNATLPDVGLQDGDRVVIYQLGDGIASFLPGATPVGGGIPNTGSKYNACTATFLGGKWYFAPFGYSGTLPTESTGGDQIVEAVDPSDGKTYRYHIFNNVGPALFTSALRGEKIEVLVVGGGAGGETSSYTLAGSGGDGGDVQEGSATSAYYDIYTLAVGGSDASSYINLSSGKVTAAAGSGFVLPENAVPPTQLSPGWASALGVTHVGGSGDQGVGPVNGTLFGSGGGGGFKLKEPYSQQSYIYKWTTGGPYNYDCSYGARAEQYQSGTNTVVYRGDACQGPNKDLCPGGWYCVQAGQPVNWCETQVAEPIYSTRYHCDSGGSLSGTTCVRTCSGDNTQHHQETRWTDCVTGMAPLSRVCTDTRATGSGSGESGVVVVRYEVSPSRRRSLSLTTVSKPTIY